jgi:hypothetical protein
MKKKSDDWRATSVFLRSDTSLGTSAPTQTKKETLLVDLHEAASILGIPVTAVRRLIAEDKLPATAQVEVESL